MDAESGTGEEEAGGQASTLWRPLWSIPSRHRPGVGELSHPTTPCLQGTGLPCPWPCISQLQASCQPLHLLPALQFAGRDGLGVGGLLGFCWLGQPQAVHRYQWGAREGCHPLGLQDEAGGSLGAPAWGRNRPALQAGPAWPLFHFSTWGQPRGMCSSPTQPQAGAILTQPAAWWFLLSAVVISWCTPMHPSRPVSEDPSWEPFGIQSIHLLPHFRSHKALGWNL